MRATDALYVKHVRPAMLAMLRALPGDRESFDAAVAAIDAGGWKTWDEFIFYGTYHGVLGPIDAALATNARLSERVRTASERRRALEELWNAHLVAGLTEAIRILTSAGVQTCALKGPVLAARVYPTAAARHCLDIDLLVRRADVEHALRAFTDAGYITDTGPSATYLLNYGHHFTLSRPGAAAIELHFRTYAGFGVELPADAILDRAELFVHPGTPRVLVLSPEDEFIYLAAHAAGHSFIRLVWLYDLKLFLGRYTLDWDIVAARAEAVGLVTVVAYTIQVLERWLQVTIPHLPARLRWRGVRRRIADRLLAEASTPQDKSLRDNIGGLLFTSVLCDRVRSGAWLVQHHVLRMARRRLYRIAPVYLPEHWSA